MKKYLKIGIILATAVCILGGFYKISPGRCTESVDARSVDYGDIYARYNEFELGKNRYGMVIFKNPKLARQKAVELCSGALETIRQKYDLEFKPDSQEHINAYLSYGDQMPGISEKEMRQIGFLGTSISICQHSKIGFYENKGLFRLAPPAV